MTKVQVLLVPGTSETNLVDTDNTPNGLLKTVSDRLDQEKFFCKEVIYAAVYGTDGMNYIQSRQTGIDMLIHETQTYDGPTIWIGYSQGADSVGEASKLIPELGLNVIFIGLVADPARHPDQNVLIEPHPAGSYGITGQRLVQASCPVWTAAATGDPICALPEGNPLRSVADGTKFMSSNFISWFLMTLKLCQESQAQRWWDLGNWKTWGGAIAYARGYLFDGRHTRAYVDEGHTLALAIKINQLDLPVS